MTEEEGAVKYDVLSLLIVLVAAPQLTFLNLFPGAQATALAGCVSAVTEYPTVAYYNPAGLTLLPGDNFTITHSHLQPKYKDVSGSFHEYFGFTTPLTARLSVGLHGLFFVRGETEIFSFTTKEKAGFDVAIGVSLGYRLFEHAAVGVTPKYIYSMNLQTGSESKDWTVAADFGALYTLLPAITVGGVVQNIGEDIHYNIGNESRTLPRRFKLGLKLTPLATREFGLFFTPEITIPFDSTRIGKGVGAEFNWRTILFLRAGLFNDQYRNGFTIGGGFRYKRLNVDVGTDERLFPKPRMYWKFSLSFRS